MPVATVSAGSCGVLAMGAVDDDGLLLVVSEADEELEGAQTANVSPVGLKNWYVTLCRVTTASS